MTQNRATKQRDSISVATNKTLMQISQRELTMGS